MCCCWQGVQHFKDIRYTPSMTYGELFMQNEYEMSCYNLDEANVEGQRQRFELYQQVCEQLWHYYVLYLPLCCSIPVMICFQPFGGLPPGTFFKALVESCTLAGCTLLQTLLLKCKQQITSSCCHYHNISISQVCKVLRAKT